MFRAATEELFPVLGATEFFTDMHRVLKIVSAGNVRTLCHNRLRLLEQVMFLPGLLKVVSYKSHSNFCYLCRNGDRNLAYILC